MEMVLALAVDEIWAEHGGVQEGRRVPLLNLMRTILSELWMGVADLMLTLSFFPATRPKMRDGILRRLLLLPQKVGRHLR
jgi:hypothetical protein